MSVVWVGMALLFNAGVWWSFAATLPRKAGAEGGALHHRRLVDYLLSIRTATASGLIHIPTPDVDIRNQWDHLIEIASRLLGYSLEGKEA